MNRNFACRFRIVVGLLLMSIIAASRSADIGTEKIHKDFVGSWIVDVEGETRTRTLNIKGAEPAQDSVWTLDSTYGWSDGNQTPVSVRLTIKPEGYLLLLTTQANSLVSADYEGPGRLRGTFTWSSGKTRHVKLERLSTDEIAKRAADSTGSRIRSTIKLPTADVPASCAGFVGGWKGNWNWNIQTWLWVVEVSSSCTAKASHRSTSAFPGSFQTVEIKDGVLAIRDVQGYIDSFELHGDQLWSRHAEPGRDNTGVFRKFQPIEK